MTDAAARNDRRLAVVFQQRTGSAAAHVRGLLDSGALGRPLVATCQTLWFRDPAYFAVPWRGKWATEGGGPTLGLGIHQIDLLAWLLGDWASVQGQLWRLDRETQMEDVSTAVIAFAGGTVASVITSALSPRETSSIRIDTELATVTVDHLYGHGHEHWRITPAPHVDAETAAAWALPEVEEASGHDPLVRDIYAALRVGRAAAVDRVGCRALVRDRHGDLLLGGLRCGGHPRDAARRRRPAAAASRARSPTCAMPDDALFHDPVHDGATDPTVIRHRDTGEWWMFYTQRRATVDEPGVAWVHGSPHRRRPLGRRARLAVRGHRGGPRARRRGRDALGARGDRRRRAVPHVPHGHRRHPRSLGGARAPHRRVRRATTSSGGASSARSR